MNQLTDDFTVMIRGGDGPLFPSLASIVGQYRPHRLLNAILAQANISTFVGNTTFELGQAVVQLGEALRYKPEGRGFDSRWCHLNFSLAQSFRPQCGPGVDSASNRNEYQEYLMRVKAAGA